jgi:hypothetical protein
VWLFGWALAPVRCCCAVSSAAKRKSGGFAGRPGCFLLFSVCFVATSLNLLFSLNHMCSMFSFSLLYH